ncbi:hypothetical protein [Streptomyces nymphaeiformis]|uniref:Tetratricopeptide (TPR) repeat protein n=1 Tax=Streptomyces nymphaeiformis TaxID=2663842 RepID=A0A7W7U386_9ACTN|nr:hypothetical protein [Streptomyces nymphaeiformis]MBB4984189.1 tetratricopeptide (TPR) repeat protein [Streptomyces nymphaeiformis]
MVTTGKDGAPLAERLACLALLLLFFISLRRAMLASSAYKPGPVAVRKLTASTAASKERLEDLTAQLRKQLSETNLYPPTTLPADAPGENFLDLLGDVDVDPKKLGTSLLRLFSRLRPKISYTVAGVLRERPQDPRFGVTVTVTSYALGGSRTETLWETTWEQAVDAAAYLVMATLVPVTRASRTPPWREWRGRNLKPELFAAYQKAKQFSQDRRFDEALDRYYAALRLDPTNLFLRSQLASTQEKMWLHLDALETYYGALLLDGLNSKQRDKRLARPAWKRIRLRYRWWHSGLLTVRYRYAVVLGMSERTAEQWCRGDTSECPRRARVRQEIREMMTPALIDRYWRTLVGKYPPIPGPLRPIAAGEAKGWLKAQLNRRNEQVVRVIFQLACSEELRQLAKDYPWGVRLWIFRPHHKQNLTGPSLRINRDVWAPLRLAWADHGTSMVPDSAKKMAWPTVPEDLERKIKGARFWWHWPWTPWQDSYNAACTYAVAMQGHLPGNLNREDLARKAVGQLENAARSRQRDFLSIKRSWLLIEDPDLEELRQEDCFIHFERKAYPHFAPDHHRPNRPMYTEITAYDQQLLVGCAHVMEHTWRMRRSPSGVEKYVLREWLVNEKRVWECVYRITADRGRNWPDRENLLQVIQNTSDPALLAKYDLPSQLPELDDLLDDAAWSNPGNAKGYIERKKEAIVRRFEGISSDVSEDSLYSPIHLSGQWISAMRRDGAFMQTVDESAVQRLCAGFEAAWMAVSEELDPDEADYALTAALLDLPEPTHWKTGRMADGS